jgi:arylsulfatase A-like enzyme/Tfp pilus assembly protein PilF
MKRSSLFLLWLALACAKDPAPPAAPAARPSILLITLDTTRADAMGANTPSFNALAARGRQYRQGYATTPQTLPSHSSMMTGLYPAGHGVHENGRYLGAAHPVLAEQLQRAGYRTTAFVSAFALARRFGLARGFVTYDDDFGPDAVQRSAKETTERAIPYMKPATQPLFMWVHYYDPHYPYEPPEPFRTRFAKQPYAGEVAAMDEQVGRLVAAFERIAPAPHAIIIAADHGEGLGDHGEQQHGNLLYQETMHVPFAVVGPGFAPSVDDTPVSTRRIYHTILGWAGLDAPAPHDPVVAGEAMKPFLDYGWQPQVMAVEGSQKAILAGRLEVYDVAADPGETRDLAAQANVSRNIRATLRDYPIPSPAKPAAPVSDEEQRKLASLGYVASTVAPVVRAGAPRAADMTHLFPLLDRASGLFVREQYAEALPLLERIQREDPYNLDAALRLATAHSTLGHDAKAVAAFQRAQAIAPESRDVRTYLALHYARGREWQRAIPLLEEIVAAEPDRLPPLEALALIRERQGRVADAIRLREKVYSMRAASGAELARLGELQMAAQDTAGAIASFEKAQHAGVRRDLELGVLYLAARRFEEARNALDRVPATHPGYPMALFKRAQVSVLLNEPDRAARIDLARRRADATTRDLIARERLFR